ncbi:MAG: metal-sensitive transcriptional regulator [Candidatus Dojkabacteria bacterium]
MDKRHKKTTKDRALHRIKIIQGHLKKIESMLTDDTCCLDIVHQSRAVQKAMKQLDLLIIEEHLKTGVVHQMRNGEGQRTTHEILRLFEYK